MAATHGSNQVPSGFSAAAISRPGVGGCLMTNGLPDESSEEKDGYTCTQDGETGLLPRED